MKMVATGVCAAALRFGHDAGLGPLAVIFGLEGAGDRVAPEDAWETSPGWKWMPMAANLQVVFYRDKSGEVLVKVLYNEQETKARGLVPLAGPYYRWQDLREHVSRAIERFGDLK